MTAILQWMALAVCVACTLWRLPAMFQGRNRGLFWAFALVSLSVALSIPAIYLSVDGALGGVNFVNVFLRLSLFVVFFLLASKVATAYDSPLARRLIRGPVGLTLLLVSSAGICITYLISDLDGSSAGLRGFFNQPSVQAYAWFGRLYPAFAALCAVLPTWRAAFSRRPPLYRAAAMSMSIGFLMACAASLIQMSAWHNSLLLDLLSFSSILFVATGLALVWLSFLRRPVTV
ncbi:hypothetical protein AOC05_10565 [Arthrobacter alpinus]|uniref:Uncharacterized protein n=1 Tax=Arthrobacter alpinus TaxID=656366 RepID=A0A0M4QN24_9MICC|nr:MULTISPECIES: hypothetical protein [Arthrobacter]ALE92647.1 hypothetical protein AOC05_10565 [Arthrobacter alpinus]